MYIGFVQTPNNSHDEWRPDCVRTLLVAIFRYDVEDMGEHLLENICSISMVRLLRVGL
jgi:hypothetical protein